MPNYQTAKIYKIWSPSHPEDIYIGSTTQALACRMAQHRRNYKRFQNGKFPYTTSFKILECGYAKIELIEKVECKCKEELTAKEGYYIRTLDCVNKQIPGRTRTEYNKQYYESNKEKIAQRVKEYREDNKEKIAQRKKKYHEANKEKIAQRKKEYREANKEKIKDRQAEKITCGCGSVIARGGLARHKKSKKHIEYLESIKS